MLAFLHSNMFFFLDINMIIKGKILVQRMYNINNKSPDRSLTGKLSEALHLLAGLACSHLTNSYPLQHAKTIYCVLVRLIPLFQSYLVSK